MKQFSCFISILFLLIFIFLSINVQGQGVLFSENRMILKDRSISSLQVCNPTAETRFYSLSFINKFMDEQGSMHALEDSLSPPSALKPYLRIFPRTIELAPGECQEVQVQLRTTTDLPDGEYRSYLYFLPRNPNASEVIENASGVKMDIQFRVGAAIPVIFRKRTHVDQITIDSICLNPALDEKLRDEMALLNFRVERRGTQSVYGRFLIEGVSGGEKKVVLNDSGKAIFPEIDYRNFTLPIPIKGLDVDSEGKTRITISYIDAEIVGDPKPKVWIQQETHLSIPH